MVGTVGTRPREGHTRGSGKFPPPSHQTAPERRHTGAALDCATYRLVEASRNTDGPAKLHLSGEFEQNTLGSVRRVEK
jgi:hypothetical protein